MMTAKEAAGVEVIEEAAVEEAAAVTTDAAAGTSMVTADAAQEEVPPQDSKSAEGGDTAIMSRRTTETMAKSADTLNSQIQEYTDRLIKEFENSIEETGEGYQGLDISYEVVTDTDTWFTLQINALQTMASGAQQIRYYHIDKTTGEVVRLQDLFREDADYVTVLSDEIKGQMMEQMKIDENVSYFCNNEEVIEGDFQKISEEQNFYFNEKNELVIVFDEYEVAPGSMGCPEFVIPDEIYNEIRRSHRFEKRIIEK